MIGPNKLERITRAASIEFWKIVQKELPECDVDKLDFGTIAVLLMQMKAAIERYADLNTKVEDEETEETEIYEDIAYSSRTEDCFGCGKRLKVKWFTCRMVKKSICDDCYKTSECKSKHGKQCVTRAYQYGGN